MKKTNKKLSFEVFKLFSRRLGAYVEPNSCKVVKLVLRLKRRNLSSIKRNKQLPKQKKIHHKLSRSSFSYMEGHKNPCHILGNKKENFKTTKWQ